jgi:hypothetical protein
MSSIVDEWFCKEGFLDPDLIGITQVRAGEWEVSRVRGETERDFVGRALCEAKAQGYRVIHIFGALHVSYIEELARPAPPGIE